MVKFVKKRTTKLMDVLREYIKSHIQNQ